ncbi:hypothetical protein Aperf_G00000005548 [Anoplocephala perfoliata]
MATFLKSHASSSHNGPTILTVPVFLLKTAELSDCYQSPHHYQTPQLACWPAAAAAAAALESGSISSSPQAGAALYNPYLAAPGAAARVGTPAMTGMGSPSEVHQVLAALAAATAAATTSPVTMKDSRWLTLEVCRQYQRKMCSRDENECKFAHPPPHVDVQNGRVICCYDSIKGKCQRRDPPCKYFHPPQHLRELLLQNGRNNLILKNMQLQLLQQQFAQGAMLPGLSAALAAATAAAPTVASSGSAGTHGIAGAPQCPNPTSPVTSASIGPTGKLIYPPAPSLNLTPQGMAANYSLLLSQPTPSSSQTSHQPTPQSLSAVAALTAADLDAPATNPLAQMFTAQQKAPFMDPLCAGLYGQAQMASPGGTRKRTANESVYAPLLAGPSMLAYGGYLDPTVYQQICANPLLGFSLGGVSLSPYLTPTQLNSMAAAAATAAALKSVPSTVPLANGGAPGTPGGLSAAHLAAIAAAAAAANASAMAPMGAPATPAKRPALADAKSGLPVFDYGPGIYAMQTQLPGAKNNIQQAQAMSPQGSQALPGSNSGSQENGAGTENRASSGEVDAQKNLIAATAVGQFYPETSRASGRTAVWALQRCNSIYNFYKAPPPPPLLSVSPSI